MKIKWIAPSLLALCIASAGAIKAHAIAPQPTTSAASLSQDHDQDRWDQPSNDWRDAQRRGFHEGMEAARRDMQEGRHKDADDHEVYKHPPVDGGDARKDFREGFREGYRRAIEHMRNDHDDAPHL